MIRGAAVLGVLAAFAAPVHGTQDPRAADLRAKLGERLDAVAGALDGVMGFAIVGLESDERFERLANQTFPTASTIKLAILYELFRQADEGRIDLDARKDLDRLNAVGGTGILSELTTPSLSIRDYATLMIVLSDNTATNVLIDAVGMEAVTRRMASLGLQNTRLRRKMIDLKAARRGI